MAQVRCVKISEQKEVHQPYNNCKPCEEKAFPHVTQPATNTYQKTSTEKVVNTTNTNDQHHSLGDKVKDAVHSVINKIHPHEHKSKKVHKNKNKGNNDSSSDSSSSSSSSESESDNETHTKKTVTKKAFSGTVKKEAVNGTCQKKI